MTVAVSVLCLAGLVFALATQQYWVVSGLALFFLMDALRLRWKVLSRSLPFFLPRDGFRSRITRLLSLYEKSDDSSEQLLLQEIRLAKNEKLSPYESRAIEALGVLVEFRRLCFGKPFSGKSALQEAFVYHFEREQNGKNYQEESDCSILDFSIVDISEAATSVASIYWKVFHVAIDSESRLAKPARQLLEAALGSKFDADSTGKKIEALADAMQRQGGLPYLVLNLVRRHNWSWAKPLGQRLLTSDLSIEEEARACLYWITEIQWFTKEAISISDYESTIRYLYHLCFTNPERAGFLEIDSQFFSQFDTVNELAREGFLFKETLIDEVLSLWREQSVFFDSVFKEVLQSLTRQKNKIYNERESWVKFWEREKEGFEKEFLFLLEGNLCYVQKDFEAAQDFYDKALEVSPSLRPALLNRVFSYAKLGDRNRHQLAVHELLEKKSLFPLSLSVVGNSFLLLGEDEEAELYYHELRKVEGWGRKTDYYKSTFCYENGLFEKALEYALKAREENPEDSSVSFHLSQCFAATGQKVEALEVLKKIENNGPQWLNFYRFTLERDSGRLSEAHQTLLAIPCDYFDDPDELEAAMDFAKNTSDLNLLRRLKARR
jgi:tetratricopeptide (TPR) repeat protein